MIWRMRRIESRPTPNCRARSIVPALGSASIAALIRARVSSTSLDLCDFSILINFDLLSFCEPPKRPWASTGRYFKTERPQPDVGVMRKDRNDVGLLRASVRVI